jgi:hypothetical protein
VQRISKAISIETKTNNNDQTGLYGSSQETQSDAEWVGELLLSWTGQESLSGDRSTRPQTAALVAVSQTQGRATRNRRFPDRCLYGSYGLTELGKRTYRFSWANS